MPVFAPNPGMPGLSSETVAYHRQLGGSGHLMFKPGGWIIDGTKTRDPFNAYDVTRLSPGLLMGRITSSLKWAPSCIGLTTAALASTGTTVTVGAAVVTELVRRIGSTGTFKLTGPPSAAGTVRTLTATYSAASGTSITITALGVNEVQTVNLSTAGTAGNLRLIVQKVDGTYALTPNIAWSATDATLLSNAQTALDTATGVTNGIVATAIAATDTDLGMVLTYSGTGYAGNTWALAEVHTLFTSNTGSNVVRTTTGVPGAFVSGSMIQPTDGSETILTFIEPGWDKVLPADGTSDIPFERICIGGDIDTTRLLPAVSDSSLKTYIRAALNAGGKFSFVDMFGD